MKIRLNEIPVEGRSYLFDRESGELNSSLSDLVGTGAYEVSLLIRPISNAYEMKGKVQAVLKETCSKCGWEFDLPVERRVHEILFEEQDDHRKSHSVHGNQSVDYFSDGPTMTPIHGDVFEPGKFVHEVIALEEPFYPVCGNGECERIDEVREMQRKLELELQMADQKATGHPAFAALNEVISKKN